MDTLTLSIKVLQEYETWILKEYITTDFNYFLFTLYDSQFYT